MDNNQRPRGWWKGTPKIVNGKLLVVAIGPDGEETTSLFTLEELAAHLAQPARSEAGDAGEPDLSDATCYNGNHPAKDGICLVDGGYKPSSR